MCSLEDKIGASSEDFRGTAFINGPINFKSGQEIVLQPRLKGGVKNLWNIISSNCRDLSD